jgi:hypothetical protein
MEILPGSKIVGKSGKVLLVDRIEGEKLICGDRYVLPSAVVKVIPPDPPQSDPPPTPTSPPTAIQIGDRLRRMPAKRTPYPASWFGKDAVGNPLPDMRPSISELVGTVTGFASDGFKVRTVEGRNFRVSHEAIELGEWIRVPEEN